MAATRAGLEPQVGDIVQCWRELSQAYLDGKIVKVRLGKAGQTEYFITYIDFNKRWDEWLTIDDMNLSTLQHKSAEKSKKRVSSNADQGDGDMSYFGEYRNIEYLRFSKFNMRAWYFAPVPVPFSDLETLYCCEYCMRFFDAEDVFLEHVKHCEFHCPPGDEIYRSGYISVYEVDGAVARRYSVNLCLITKLFLFHKFQYYDPKLFLFYIVCIAGEHGDEPCGFFSKEKYSDTHNLACIITFPCYQGLGVGRFMISLSYRFSIIEKKPGTPEKPLSDLGLTTYRSYWKDAVIECLWKHRNEDITISAISNYTGLTIDDIKFAIRDANLLRPYNDTYTFVITKDQVKTLQDKQRRRRITLDPNRLRWTPFPRSQKKQD